MKSKNGELQDYIYIDMFTSISVSLEVKSNCKAHPTLTDSP